MPQNKNSDGFDEQKYIIVINSLKGQRPTVGYDTALLSLEQASRNLQQPQTEEFLQKCLQQLVNMFLEQKYMMMLPEQRGQMEKTLHYATVITLASIANGSDQYVQVLGHLLNSKRPYYKALGDRQAFNISPGSLEVRSKLLRHINASGGFKHVAGLFQKNKDERNDNWLLNRDGNGLGGEALRSILQALCELLSSQDAQRRVIDEASVTIANVVAQQLEGISEGLVKSEGVDILNRVIFVLRRLLNLIGGTDGEQNAFEYWTTLTLRYLKSSSLPLRLVGCEHSEKIINIAEESLPSVESYCIHGAGNGEVNGEYKLTRRDRSSAVTWTKRNKETGLLLTLFQCGIANFSKKWWFISEADSESPGTEKDVDYYKHEDVSQRHKHHPPMTGWRPCSGKGERGKEPPPVIKPIGGTNIPPNSSAAIMIRNTLQSEVIASVFGDSMHREVVARSSTLLLFLAKMKSLTTCHIDLIWRSCLRCGEAELCDEILLVLATLCPHLELNLTVHLLNTASELTNKEGHGGMKMGVKDSFRRNSRSLPPNNNTTSTTSSSSSSTNVPQAQYNSGEAGMAMKLANKLADMNILYSIPYPIEPKLLDALLGLVWGLVSLPPDLWRLNKQPPQKVRNMARDLLRCHCVGDSHHMKALTECLALLRTSSITTSLSLPAFKSSRTTSAGNAGGTSNGRQSPYLTSPSFDEDNLLHTFSLACLVLENFPSASLRRLAVDRLASEHGLIELLSAEIAAWRARRSSHFPIGNSQGSISTISSLAAPSVSSNHNFSSPLSVVSGKDESPRVVNLAGAMSASSLTTPNPTSIVSSVKGNGAPHPNTISTLSSELGARLDLWAVVYSASPSVSLGKQQLAGLWKLLQLPEEKERCLSFFDSALSFYTAQKDGIDEYDESSFSCFGETEICFISSELMSKDTDWTYLGVGAYLCLRAFQRAITDLKHPKKGERDMDLLTDLSQQLQRSSSHVEALMDDENCLDVLWSVYLKCRDQEVAVMAQQDLISIYNDFAYVDKLEIMQSRFLSRCIGYLAQSNIDLNQNDQFRMSIGDVNNNNINITGDFKSVRLRILRCLMILKASLTKSRGTMPIPHVLRSSSNLIQVSVSGKRVEVSGPQNSTVFVDVERFTLYVHPLETIRSVRLKIRDKAASNYPIHSIILHHNSCLLQNDAKMIRDEKFFNNRLSFVANMNYNFYGPEITTEEMLVSPQGMIHIGEIIAGTDDFFNALFNLLQHPKLDDPIQPTNLNNPPEMINRVGGDHDLMEIPTSTAIWEFLLTLPTQQSLEKVTLMCCDVQQSSQQASPHSPKAPQSPRETGFKWKQLFDGNDNWHRAVYFLQLCDLLLSPNIYNDDVIATELSQDFKEKFLNTGGLKQVLNMFMTKNLGANNTTQTALVSMGTMTALRMINLCIFGTSDTISPPLNDNQETKHESFNWKEALGMEIILPFLGKLVMILLSTHHNIEKYILNERQTNINRCLGVDNLIEDALFTVTLLIKSEPLIALEYFTSNSQVTKELIVNLLVLNKESKVRMSMRMLCLDSFKSFALEISHWLIDQLKLLRPDCSTCDELFNVLGSFVRRNIQGLNYSNMAQVIVKKLLETSEFCTKSNDNANSLDHSAPMVDDESPSYELQPNNSHGGETMSISIMLSRCLILLSDIMKLDPLHTLQDTELESKLVSTLTQEFLFTLPEKSHSKIPVCLTGGALAYKSAFGLLQVACRNRTDDLVKTINELSKLSQVCRGELKRQWSVECSSDSKAKGMKFSGLWNQGCTCYMNSALQQLFMIEPLRKAIIEATMDYERMISGEKFDPVEMIGSTISIECYENPTPGHDMSTQETRQTRWLYAKVETWITHENNHLITFGPNDHPSQHFKGMQKFNVLEGRSGIETGQVYVHRNLNHIAPTRPLKSDDALTSACHVLEQMQKTFMYLARTEKRYVDCRPLVEACNCMALEFNVFQQNDAPEFYDKLMHKLEDALKTTDKFADYERCFGMKVVNQSIPKEQTDRFKAREKSDTIMKVELKVQGMDTVEESLDDFVKDEVMDGDNKIEFEDEDNKSEKLAGVRRTCLSQLPNILVLHLKRFDLDFNTFQTVKLNNRCSFPTRLNMKPYTKAGMEARDAELLRTETAAENDPTDPASSSSMSESPRRGTTPSSFGSPSRSTQAIPSSSPKSSDGIPTLEHQNLSSSSSKVSDENDGVNGEEEDIEFLYDLRGVLVHAGGSQAGHYYSFSKDSTDNQWYKFDDDDVTLWNQGDMEKECFGGTYQFQRGKKTLTRDLVANALMIFYDKVSPNKDVPTEENVTSSAMTDRTTSESEEEAVKSKKKNPDDFVSMSGIQIYQDEVYDSNLRFRRLGYIFDSNLHDFLRTMLSGVSGVCYNLEEFGRKKPNALYWPSVVDSMKEVTSQITLSPLQMHVAQYCISFFLDIHLHSREREREATQLWVKVISDVFEKHPCAAIWFLHQIVWDEAKHESWMKDFLLLCPDYFARIAFVNIIVAAVKRVAPLEESLLLDEAKEVSSFMTIQLPILLEHSVPPSKPFRQLLNLDEFDDDLEDELYIDDEQCYDISMSTIRDENDNVIGIPNQKSPSICVDVVRCVIAFLSPKAQAVANENYGCSDEVLLLVQKLAECHDSIRKCFIAHDTIAKLIYMIVGRNKSSEPVNKLFHYVNKYSENKLEEPMIKFQNPFEYHTSFNNMDVNLKPFHELMDAMPGLEAITALIDVPQVPRAALLVDKVLSSGLDDLSGQEDVFNYDNTLENNTVFDNSSLSPAAIEVFTDIFKHHSPMKTFMEVQDLASYFEFCGRSKALITKVRMDRIMNKYGHMTSSRLHLDGFLDYYKSLSLTNPKEVWSHLMHLGYRNDLSHFKDESSLVGKLDSSSQGSVLVLPPISTEALSSWNFFELASDNIEESLPMVIERICRGNADTSLNLLKESLLELAAPRDWESRALVDQCESLYSTLANLDDQFSQERLEFIFLRAPSSIFTAAQRFFTDMEELNQQVQRLRQPHHQQYDPSIFQRFQSVKNGYGRYEQLIQLLLKNEKIGAYLNHPTIKASWEWMEEYQQQQQLMLQEQQSRRQQMLDQQAMRVSAWQSNAPDAIEVEGAGKTITNAVFVKQTSLVDDAPYWVAENIMLYRCCLESKQHHWFISQVANGSEPGYDGDIDFYSVPSRNRTKADHIPYEPMPPKTGWRTLPSGIDPPPTVEAFDYGSETASATGVHTSDDDSMDEWSGSVPDNSFEQ